MKNLLSFFLMIILISCENKTSKTTTSREKKQIEKQDISGDWKCVDVYCEKICEVCCEDLLYREIRISNDSLYEFEYPFQYYGVKKAPVQLENTLNQKKISRSTNNRQGFSGYILTNDTLVIDGTDFFVRTKFDEQVIHQLKRDSINPSVFKGEWELDTWTEMGYNGEVNYDGTIHFPFTLPKKLRLDENKIKKQVKGHWVTLPVNGVNREFYIVNITEYGFRLRTGNWYKEGFELDYNLKTN